MIKENVSHNGFDFNKRGKRCMRKKYMQIYAEVNCIAKLQTAWTRKYFGKRSMTD